MEKLLNEFIENLSEKELVKKDDTIIIACSGGIDSVVLSFMMVLSICFACKRLIYHTIDYSLFWQRSPADSLKSGITAGAFPLTNHTKDHARLAVGQVRR